MLKNLEFHQVIESGAGGITWLELFTLYNLSGGRLDIKGKITNNRVTLEKSIGEFRQRTMHLVKMCVPAHQAYLFGPASNTKYPLEGLGINSSVATLKIGVNLTDQQRLEL